MYLCGWQTDGRVEMQVAWLLFLFCIAFDCHLMLMMLTFSKSFEVRIDRENTLRPSLVGFDHCAPAGDVTNLVAVVALWCVAFRAITRLGVWAVA